MPRNWNFLHEMYKKQPGQCWEILKYHLKNFTIPEKIGRKMDPVHKLSYINTTAQYEIQTYVYLFPSPFHDAKNQRPKVMKLGVLVSIEFKRSFILLR